MHACISNYCFQTNPGYLLSEGKCSVASVTVEIWMQILDAILLSSLTATPETAHIYIPV